MSEMFGRLGLSDDDSAEAFHTFSSYVIGAVIFAATRVVANEQLGRSGEGNATISGASAALAPPHPASSRGRAMEAMVDVSVRDPQLDEDLFAHGLRRLLASFAATAAPRTGGPPIEA
jgi:hypothetical protein